MRFGIYCEIQTPPGKAHYDMTWEIMRQIEHADQCGFDVYSVIDHHFFQKFSISANPLAMFAAAAQRTQRIRFRTALHTLPLENPMRLAGMIAETDILTNGRLECGLGRGHAWLFGPSSLPLEESRAAGQRLWLLRKRRARVADEIKLRRNRRAGDWIHRPAGESRSPGERASGKGRHR